MADFEGLRKMFITAEESKLASWVRVVTGPAKPVRSGRSSTVFTGLKFFKISPSPPQDYLKNRNFEKFFRRPIFIITYVKDDFKFWF